MQSLTSLTPTRRRNGRCVAKMDARASESGRCDGLLTRLLGVGGIHAVAQGAAAMGVGVGGHEVLAVQVDAVGITKGNVGSFRQLRPVTADHVDTEAQDDKNRERGIEVEVRTGNHRADDQQDDRRQEPQVSSPILA